MATIKDVAALVGVSTATVSHALNGTRYVSEATVERIKEVVREIGYVSNASAKALRSKKSGRIGLMVPGISSYFAVDADIIAAIEQVFSEANFQISIGITNEDIGKEMAQIEQFNYQQIEGLLMFPAPGDHGYLDALPQKYPIVFMDRLPMGCVRDCVLANNEEATYNTVLMMLDEGVESIGVLTGMEGISSVEERMRGYYRALSDRHVPCRPELIVCGNSTIKGAYAATKQLLSDHPGQVPALLSMNHLMTIGMMMSLTDMGVRVPEEIRVIGMGDSAWAHITNPPLSVLRHPTAEIGKVAAELLLGRIRGEEMGEEQTIRLPMQMVRRKSF